MTWGELEPGDSVVWPRPSGSPVVYTVLSKERSSRPKEIEVRVIEVRMLCLEDGKTYRFTAYEWERVLGDDGGQIFKGGRT